MDGSALPRRLRWLVIVLTASLAGCAKQAPVAELPGAAETMARIGRRLSGSLSVQELTALAAHGDRLLARLTLQERNALAQGAFRFRVDRPVEVEVATPARRSRSGSTTSGSAGSPARSGSPAPTGPSIEKRFPAGWVGLGVNGLDRTPKAHYVVFVRPAEPGPTARARRDRPGRLADRDRARRCQRGLRRRATDRAPARPPARVALAPAGARPAARDDAGAVARLEDARPCRARRPTRSRVAFGLDPARSLVWTWRTDPGVRRRPGSG